MALILDTCGLLSLSGIADRKLSKNCRAEIHSANPLYISSCSAFEFALKHKRGQLDLDAFQSHGDFWEACIQKYVLSEVPVSAELFIKAVQLPDHHADPFDRIIMATAFALACPVVTYDKLFDAYSVKTIH